MGRHSSGERRSRLESSDPHPGTVEDLRLLVSTRRLLLTSIAAVVAIFGVYFGLLVVLDRSRDWLLLLIIPAGLAGVAVGALLDRAHSARSETSARNEISARSETNARSESSAVVTADEVEPPEPPEPLEPSVDTVEPSEPPADSPEPSD